MGLGCPPGRLRAWLSGLRSAAPHCRRRRRLAARSAAVLARLRELDVRHNRLRACDGLAALAGTLRVLNLACNAIAAVDGLVVERLGPEARRPG